MEVNADQLAKLIISHVPAQYQPQLNGPVRGIGLLSNHHLKRLNELLTLTESQQSTSLGLCIDVNELSQQERPDRFQIYLARDFEDADQLLFVLLHEVGHVDWHMNPERRQSYAPTEAELYADLFAFETLADTSTLEHALDLLVIHGSDKGFADEILRYAK